MPPEKVLSKAEKYNTYLYLQACMERRRFFTPMVYSADGIPVVEALATQKKLVSLISFKLKQE